MQVKQNPNNNAEKRYSTTTKTTNYKLATQNLALRDTAGSED